MRSLRVVSLGLGPIGQAAARLVLSKRSLQLAGAADPDPAKAGRDLGALLGLPTPLDLPVHPDPETLLASTRPDVVLHCTSSFLDEVAGQILLAVGHGAHVVSSTEQLLYPWLAAPDTARALDEAARAAGVAVLGTGVNPGFVMDTLAVVATAACSSVEAIHCRRVVDVATRRLPLQRKVGAGMSPEEFRRRAAAGRFGHIGLRESVALVAKACGFALDSLSGSLEPVLAGEERTTPHLTVGRGQVAGLRERAEGREGERVRVAMDLEMYVGAPEPADEVRVVGTPPLRLLLPGGIPGDAATAGVLVNMVPRVAGAPPGLRTMLDMVLPGILP